MASTQPLPSVSPRYHRNDAPHPCGKLYLVIKKSPHIAAIVRELHIQEGQAFREQDWVNKSSGSSGLIKLLNSLTHLEKLHLRRINWVQNTPELRVALRGLVASTPITSLDLELCNFPLESFISLFNTCSNLKCLTLRGMRIHTSDIFAEKLKLVEDEEAGNMGEEIPRRKCQLDNLQIAGCPPKIMTWISDPENALDLSHLRTLYCHVDQATKMLLYKLGGSLHHVALVYPSDDPDLARSVLDGNNGLRSLRVADIPYGPKTVLRLKELLQSVLGAQHLQKIELEINISYELEDLDTVDWSVWTLIDEIFDGVMLPELVNVDFVLYTSGYRVDWRRIRDVMIPLFPALAKRGVLVIR